MEKGWEEGLGLDLDLRPGGVLDGFRGTSPKNRSISVTAAFGKGRKCFPGLSADAVCFLTPPFEMVAGGIAPRSSAALRGAREGVSGEPGTVERGLRSYVHADDE